MTVEPVAPPLPVKRVAVLAVSVVVIATALVWAFLAMRAVMDIGGACADGGPYVSTQSCADGTWLISIAIPLLLIAAFAGTAAAVSIGAPDLLVPMWFLLFASLGGNFLDYGIFGDEPEWGFIVCGVVFELMAFPALYVLLPVPGTSSWRPMTTARPAGAPLRSPSGWWLAYLALAAIGATVGWLVWDALR